MFFQPTKSVHVWTFHKPKKHVDQEKSQQEKYKYVQLTNLPFPQQN